MSAMADKQRSATVLFTLSTAESVILVALSITLVAAVLIRILQRTGDPERDLTVRPATDALHHRIELNTASPEELTLVPGIGAARAQKIVDHRRKQGGFSAIDDLAKVDGFSGGLVSRLRRYLYIQSSAQRTPE